jgi:hypothetical protein
MLVELDPNHTLQIESGSNCNIPFGKTAHVLCR